MKNKKVILIGLIALSFVGCSSVKGIFGKSSTAVEKQNVQISKVEDKLDVVTDNKVNQISQLSFGVNDSLNRMTNKPIQVLVAEELNERVLSLSGLPTIEQQKAMVQLVTDLVSNNVAGKIELQNKDKELSALQNEETILIKQKDKELDKALELSKTIALKADTTQSELDKYQGFWGLSAVFLGLKSFILHSFWTLLICLVIFIVLRVAAATNPFANAIFGLFQSLGAVCIHMIESLIPSSMTTLEGAKADVKKVGDVVSEVAQTIQTVK